MLRDTTRAPQLFEALQCLKPLLLERCEIVETNDNPVTVTGLRIGENIRGGWAILAGARGLQRGVLRLETTRLALGTAQTRKRKPLPEHEQHLIRNALHLAALWAAEQRRQECIDPAPPITAAMLAHEEKAFLEEFY